MKSSPDLLLILTPCPSLGPPPPASEESRAIVRWTSRDINVRTRVNGYGGGAFTVYNHTLFFSNFADNAIYRQDGPEGIPQQLTNTSYRRYADGSYSPQVGKAAGRGRMKGEAGVRQNYE